MEKEKNKQNFNLETLKCLYFSTLININQQCSTSIVFAISIEILRFLLGHSLIYCVFMVKIFDNTSNGSIFLALRQIFLVNSLLTYQWLRIICLTLLFIIFIYNLLIGYNQFINAQYNTSKILYFVGSYLKVASQFLFCVFGITMYGAMQASDYFMIVIVIVQFIFMIILFKVSGIFLQKNKFQTDDLYVHNENFTVEIHNGLFSIICFIGPLLMLIDGPDFIRIPIMFLWICLQIIRMKQTVIYPYYQHEIVYKMYVCVVCLQTAQLIIHTLTDLLQFQIMKNNSISAIGIITVLAVWGVFNIYKFNIQKCYFLTVDDIKQKKQLYLFISSYYSAISSLQKSSDLSQICLVVSSIKKNHQNSCKKPKCYCHDECQLKIFLQQYLYEILLKLQIIFSHNLLIMIFICSLKFHVYRQYVNTYQKLESLEKVKQLNGLQTFLSMKLRCQLKQWIQQKKQQFNVIPICLAIRLQEDMTILNDIILDDIQTKYKKWNAFSKQLSRIQEVRNLSQKQIHNLIEIETMKSNKWEKYNRSPSFNATLYFYFKKVALKSNDLKDLEQNIKDLNRKIKQQEFGKSSLFLKHLFHKNACTVQCSIKQNNVGLIINTSKAITQMFGYKSKQIIGENITILTSKFLKQEHNSIIKKWAIKGSQINEISKSQQFYCQHKQNYSFIAQKYMMVYTGSQQITLNITFLKRNENDLILINDKGQLQEFGKSIKSILKHLPDKTQCDLVFKGLKSKLANAQSTEQKFYKTIMYNQKITNKLLNSQKKSSKQIKSNFSNQSSKQEYENQVLNGYSNSKKVLGQLKISKKQEIFNQSTIQYQNIWKSNLVYRKVEMGNLTFYKIEVKALQYVKSFDEIASRKQNQQQIISNLQNDISNGSNTICQNQMGMLEIGQQQNSSMTSMNSQLGYGISKLVSYFTFILMHPRKLSDQRINRKVFIDILFVIILIGILSTTLIINRYSLQQKVRSLKAKASIDKIMKLIQMSTNHIFTMYMYRNDLKNKKIAIDQLIWDTQSLLPKLNQHFFVINEQLTFLQGEVLYNYLRSPLNIIFKNIGTKQVELLQFFKIFGYMFIQIKKQMEKDNPNITYILDLYHTITINAKQFTFIRDVLSINTQTNIYNNDIFNRNYLIVTLIVFFFTSALYGFYVNNYRNFRFHQNQEHVKLYQMIPHQILKNLTQYYSTYYKHFILEKNKIDSCLNGQDKIFQIQFQQNNLSQQLFSGNKLKLIGRGKYWLWIGILLGFLVINGGNVAISFNMYNFNKQVEFFLKLTNKLSASQSMLVTRWIRLKSTYYFDKGNITNDFLTFMQSFVNDTQVDFNQYATFKQNWIMSGNSQFRQQFNQLLTTNPCVLNQAEFTAYQLQICNSQTILSKNGLIIYANSLSRALRNIFTQWSLNLNSILNQTDALLSQKQFKQMDFANTFHGSTFSKLNAKISSVYENGFNSQYQTYSIIFVLLILLIVGFFIWNVKKSFEDKVQLSYLYGYVLLFPSSTLKHSKYLLKFIQTNLQFSQKR